jgi:hypothetical protein
VEQPTPDVTGADVERVLRRDFEPGDAARVDALFRDINPPVSPRVALAVLKLSNGSIQAARANLEAAHRDWRDVIAYAEYPAYMQTGSGVGSLSSAQRDDIIQADWEQYTRWLNR